MADPTPSQKAEELGLAGKSSKIPYMRMVIDQAGITDEVRHFDYEGSGTKDDPFIVQWIPNDPRNPMHFSTKTKWFITILNSVATLAIALASSAYSGGVAEIMVEFRLSQLVAILGVSLFVLGFALGPLLWAPLSELFGRQILFFGTYAALTAFNAGCAGAQNAATLMILRFFAGTFGSSPLTNSGGIIADMFPASQRGTAMAVFAATPFLGPVLGPVTGGFLGEGAGWRWIMGFLAIFSGTLWILGACLTPETYAPVLLRRRASKLSKLTGKCYVSTGDRNNKSAGLAESFKIAMGRPWVLLFREPIVLLLSIYMAIIYGTLYMLFAAFPIVYQQKRGWSVGIGGLAFIGVLIGIVMSIIYSFIENKRYVKVQQAHNGFAPPEARLPPAIIGSIFLPIGLFWFAWTNQPELHWAISIAAGIPFGAGMVLLFLSVMNYLIDSYTIYAASVLAANSVLRSLFGAAFPLFTGDMYRGLGIHWASTIPAFLALACMPFPILLYKYGAAIRKRCKFAAESAAFMESMQRSRSHAAPAEVKEDEVSEEHGGAAQMGDGDATARTDRSSVTVADDSTTRHSSDSHYRAYEGNPYDIDRVNTRESVA